MCSEQTSSNEVSDTRLPISDGIHDFPIYPTRTRLRPILYLHYQDANPWPRLFRLEAFPLVSCFFGLLEPNPCLHVGGLARRTEESCPGAWGVYTLFFLVYAVYFVVDDK